MLLLDEVTFDGGARYRQKGNPLFKLVHPVKPLEVINVLYNLLHETDEDVILCWQSTLLLILD